MLRYEHKKQISGYNSSSRASLRKLKLDKKEIGTEQKKKSVQPI